MTELCKTIEDLCIALSPLTFGAPVTHTYNPLIYAREPAFSYARTYGSGPGDVVGRNTVGREALLLGMNPGPWGMAQTGVPFGEIESVRDWLKITGDVGKPPIENLKRPIEGFACTRSEVSGRRLWGWARDRFREPEAFFERFFVWNYCPLVFMEEGGANITPDKLPANERAPLFEHCDAALRDVVAAIQPRLVIGVGAFAEKRARIALEGLDVGFGRILHPSPASPKANSGWAETVDAELAALGLDITRPAQSATRG